jgi:cytochrome c-type biogenesis protein CcmH
MTWIVIAVITALAFGLAVLVLKAPRPGWEAIGAALLLGIAGYALQGHPGKAGAPKDAQELIQGNPADLVAERKRLGGDSAVQGNNWQVVADGLARHGQYADAAGVLLGAVGQEPKNADAWLALGNALVGHAEGSLSPAALYAYRKAADADPAHPGPPFFLGMALVQSGRLDDARALWAGLLARSPQDAPWRADLVSRISQLDALIAQQKAAVPPQ